jgi:uncharacterized membrane protein YcaP (DUF421 family)
LAGKHQLAQLNPFDLVVLLTLSNTVQNAIIGDDNSVTGGMVGATTLLFMNHVVVRYVYRHRRVEQLIEGQPTELMSNGIVHRVRLRDEPISPNELLTAARRQGFRTLAEIDRAILEPGGSITFFGKEPSAEVRRHAEIVARLDRLLQKVGA